MMFRRPAFNPETKIEGIEQITHGDGTRQYRTPGGDLYYSATTMLKVMDDGAIGDWKKRVGEEEAERIVSDAATRGSRFHEICEWYIRDEMAGKIIEPRHGALFNRARPHINKFSEIVAVEYPLFSDRVQAAGTVDLVGTISQKFTIGDFKSARYAGIGTKWGKKKIFKYLLQTAFYGLMWEERYGQTPEQACIIMASEYDSACQCIIEPIGPFMREAKRVSLAYRGLLDPRDLAYFKVFGGKPK